MKKNLKIEEIEAFEILDSRGNPTVGVEVILENGVTGKAEVPSGASTGSFEAVELRDKDKSRYLGRGVEKAVENINKKINKTIRGMSVFDQKDIDEEMLRLDDTPNKSNLGANSTLGVSLAVAKAASNALGLELYRYIGGINGNKLPMPMMNILNGGKHSDNNINIQEFMIIPIGEITFKEKLRRGTEVYHSLKNVLREKGYSISVGDEGGFAPNLNNEEEAIEIILEAIKKAGYEPKKDIVIALDIASTEMYNEASKINKNGYYFWKTDRFMSKGEMINYIINLCEKYPIYSIEDALSEEDWDGWEFLTEKLGKKVQLVGDDLFVTNPKRLRKGIEKAVANFLVTLVYVRNSIYSVNQVLAENAKTFEQFIFL